MANAQQQQPQQIVVPNFVLNSEPGSVFEIRTEPDEEARSDSDTVESFWADSIEVLASGYLLFPKKAWVKSKLLAISEEGIKVTLTTATPLDVVLVPEHQIQFVGVVDREQWMAIGPSRANEFLEWIMPKLDPDVPVENLYSEFLSSRTKTADNGMAPDEE